MHPLGAGQVRGISFGPRFCCASRTRSTGRCPCGWRQDCRDVRGLPVDQNGTGEPFDTASDESGIPTVALNRASYGACRPVSTFLFNPQQAQQTAEFVSHQIRAIAAGLGVPAHLVSGDLREANYGSLRAGMVAFRQKLEQIQFGTIIPQLCGPIWGTGGFCPDPAAAICPQPILRQPQPFGLALNTIPRRCRGLTRPKDRCSDPRCPGSRAYVAPPSGLPNAVSTLKPST